MEKRYQVFVSSTFLDLREERQAVQRAILEIDHMPAGMELFPASDDSAWRLISDVIDQSDYYVLIVGGRYGSTDEDGVGYTEKEYDYAVSARKPVIALLHGEPQKLPRERTETSSSAWEKLEAFRKKVESAHTCVYWTSSDELSAKVITGLTSAVKRYPAVGWVRASEVPTDATVSEILALRKRLEEMELELAAERSGPPPGAIELAQGRDAIRLGVDYRSRRAPYAWSRHEARVETTWNDLFASVAPVLIHEAPDEAVRDAMSEFLWRIAYAALNEEARADWLENRQFDSQEVLDEDYSTCIVQFRALGLLKESRRNRSVNDTRTYWALTEYGDQLMTQLRAIRREPTGH